jgi:hypothetical protein
MMLPQDWERVAQERIRSWEQEIHQRALLARWTGGSLVWLGTWLMRWGARVTPQEQRQAYQSQVNPLSGW